MKTIFFTSALLFSNYFINAQGLSFSWAGAFDAVQNQYLYNHPKAVAFDSFRNSYVAGHYNGTVDFDPSATVDSLNAGTQGSAFITKFDPQGHLIWVKSFGGPDAYTHAIGVDDNGNILITGLYGSTGEDFDPGPGTFTLNLSGFYDMFMVKLDPSGNLLWAKTIGGDHAVFVRAIEIDASGNIFTTGAFQGSSVDFDPGPSVYNLYPGMYSSIFVSKLDASGNFILAKTIYGVLNGCDVSGLCLDPSGNIILSGHFSGYVDFDPDPVNQQTLTSTGGNDVYVCKLNPLGDFLWVKQIGGSQGNETATSMKTDAAGNIYLTGEFRCADFDPGPGTFSMTAANAANYTADLYVCKLTNNGVFSWAKAVAYGAYWNAQPRLHLDATGLYVAGMFSGTVDFDPGPGTDVHQAGSSTAGFLLKLDSGGNHLWADAIGGSGYCYLENFGVDQAGDIVVTGTYSGIVDFDPGSSSYMLATQNEIFVCRLGQPCSVPITLSSPNSIICSGQTTTITATGGIHYDWGTNVTGPNIIVTLGLTSTYSVNAIGNNCFGSAVYTQSVSNCTDVNKISADHEITVFPNPFRETIQIVSANADGEMKVKICDATGRCVISQIVGANNQPISLNAITEGIYILSVYDRAENMIKTMKLVKE